MVKYHQLAINESQVDQTLIVNKVVLVVIVDQLFVEDAGNHHQPNGGSELAIGGDKIPSHVHQDVVIINQLKLICI